LTASNQPIYYRAITERIFCKASGDCRNRAQWRVQIPRSSRFDDRPYCDYHLNRYRKRVGVRLQQGQRPTGQVGLSRQGARDLKDAYRNWYSKQARISKADIAEATQRLMDTFLWYGSELAQTARWGRESSNAMEVVGDGDGT